MKNRVLNNQKLLRKWFLYSNKIVVDWGSAPDPAGGAYSAPPDPLAVWGWDGGFANYVPPPPPVTKSWLRACSIYRWTRISLDLTIYPYIRIAAIEVPSREQSGYVISEFFHSRELIL